METITCSVVAAVVSCLMSAPKPSPDAAMKIWTAASTPLATQLPKLETRPDSYPLVSGSKPSVGPWEFPPERPARRLDGTLLSEPPVVYGVRLPHNWDRRR